MTFNISLDILLCNRLQFVDVGKFERGNFDGFKVPNICVNIYLYRV